MDQGHPSRSRGVDLRGAREALGGGGKGEGGDGSSERAGVRAGAAEAARVASSAGCGIAPSDGGQRPPSLGARPAPRSRRFGRVIRGRKWSPKEAPEAAKQGQVFRPASTPDDTHRIVVTRLSTGVFTPFTLLVQSLRPSKSSIASTATRIK